jgi:hypothetical protein
MRYRDFGPDHINQINPALDRAGKLREVAMNPAAYADSMTAGAQRGVLVGFEFEVYVPAQIIANQLQQANLARSGISLFWTVAKLADDELDLDIAAFNQLFRQRRPLRAAGMTIANIEEYVKTEQDRHINNIKKYFSQLSEPTRRRIIKRWNEFLVGEPDPPTQRLFLDWLRGNVAKIRDENMDRKDTDFRLITDMFAEERDLYLTRERDIIASLLRRLSQSRRLGQERFEQSFEWDDAALAERYRDLATEIENNSDDDPDEQYGRAVPVLEPAVAKTMGARVNVFRSRHQSPKNLTDWYIEPDGSLTEPESYEDGAAEIVSPPLPVQQAMSDLKKFYGMARELDLYTNETTGLHINVSIPGDLDILKLAVFLGDDYVLKSFGREDSEFAQSVMQDLQRGADRKAMLSKRQGRTELDFRALKKLAQDSTESHFASISNNGNYISFRHSGGDYLNDSEAIINVMGRFVRAMVIAADPQAYRSEYLKKLTALVARPAKADVKVSPKDILSMRQQGVPVLDIYAWHLVFMPRDRDMLDSILVATRSFRLSRQDFRVQQLRTPQPSVAQKFTDLPPDRTRQWDLFAHFRMIPQTLRAAIVMQQPAFLQAAAQAWKDADKQAIVIEPARVPITDTSVSGVAKDISDHIGQTARSN